MLTGQQPGAPYEGGRSAAELVKLLNNRTGLHRVLGGRLGRMVCPGRRSGGEAGPAQAGRDPELDLLVKGMLQLEGWRQAQLLRALQVAPFIIEFIILVLLSLLVGV